METTAISVIGISKKFRLFNSPQERFLEAFHPFNKKYHKEFWALRDVSFDIPKGQTVGIIGRNGSGKSTLLQVLCSILKPTSGTVVADGKIAALLELGAGFNPEFTGRQNVLMKGMLMGFSQKEMRERLPEIEAFADIGEFIDQPMKIYSSGMAVRLAFACAVNVDPDILVIDEALAVGDAKFQHKCYGKFLDFQKNGKTIVFVTHDTSAVVKHCDRALLVDRGTMLMDDKPNDIVNRYHDFIFSGSTSGNIKASPDDPQTPKKRNDDQDDPSLRNNLKEFLNEVISSDHCKMRKSYNENEYLAGDKRVRFVDYLVVCRDVFDPAIVVSGDTADIYVKVLISQDVDFPLFGYGIKTVDGVLIYATNTALLGVSFLPVKKSEILILKFSVVLNLKAGDYFISFGFSDSLYKSSKAEHCWVSSRSDVVHLTIKERNCFDGLVELETTYQEISRKKIE